MSILTFEPRNHEYRYDGRVVPSVTQILKDLGFYPPYPPGSGRSRDMGTAIHKLAELHDIGRTFQCRDEELMGLFAQYKEFLKDVRPKYIGVEKKYCASIDGLLVAGAIDREVSEWKSVNGFGIIDLKRTTGDPPYNPTSLQLAGYTMISRLIDKLESVYRYSLLLKQNTYKLIPYTNTNDFRDFAALVRTWYRRNNYAAIAN